MNKAKAIGASVLGVATAAVLGVAAGIMLVHGPTNAPLPSQTPAGFVQQLDPVGTDTSTDPTTPDPTTTDPGTIPAAPPATSTDTAPPVVTTTDAPPATTVTGGDGTHAPIASPVTSPTTTSPVPVCLPDGTGATTCHN
jgi:hypothetical protein